MRPDAILGLVVVTALLVVAILFGSPLRFFLHPGALAWVCLGTLTAVATVHGRAAWPQLLDGFGRMLTSRPAPWSAADRDATAHIAGSAGTLALWVGGVGAVAAFIPAVRSTGDAAALGPGIAAAALCLFYALTANLLVFVPLSQQHRPPPRDP